MTIKAKGTETVIHARKSLLYNEGEPGIKKQGNNFDVTMGSYDGAKVCENLSAYSIYVKSIW